VTDIAEKETRTLCNLIEPLSGVRASASIGLALEMK